MRIAIASDIHGNKHAFEAVIAAAEAAEADELWCLGDLVGYGGDPDASVALAMEHCAICLAGNHDLAVVDVLSLEDFSRGAALAAQWTKETIKPETREFLLSLSPEGGAEGVGLYHASPRDPIWEYVLSGLTAELCLDTTDYRVSFIGHSHVALSFHRNEGESATGSTRREGDNLDISAGEWLINPGSTGQPRDGDPRAAWLMLDTERWTAEWRRARVRHRRGAGGDPGGEPSGLPRRAPSVRSIAPYAEIAPPWAGARRRPVAARLWQLESQTDPAGPRRPARSRASTRSPRAPATRTATAPKAALRDARNQVAELPRQVDRKLKRNLNQWLDHDRREDPDSDCKPEKTPTATPSETRDADRDADRDPPRRRRRRRPRRPTPSRDGDRDATADGDADGGTAGHRRCRSGG